MATNLLGKIEKYAKIEMTECQERNSRIYKMKVAVMDISGKEDNDEKK